MSDDNQTFQAGLIGCGRMGTTIDDEVRGRPNATLPYCHAAGYKATDRVDLVAATDIDEAQLERAKERYDIPRGYDDYREMIEQEDLDILSVTTPLGTHFEPVCFAAEYGVPAIYCEKALCRSMEQADKLVEACQTNGTHFNLGVNRRYSPLFRTIRELIEDGEIGDLRAIIGHVGAGGISGKSHAVDIVSFLNGDEPADWVQGESNFELDDIDGDQLQVHPRARLGHIGFSNGVRGYLTQAGNWEIEIDGEDGKIRTFNNGHTATIRTKQGEWDFLQEQEFPEYEPRSGTLGCIDELVAALDGGPETSGNIEIAAAGQEICMAMFDSHRRNGERVSLPLENRALTLP